MSDEVIVVTGFPGSFLGRRVFLKLVEEKPRAQLRCIVPTRFMNDAKRDLAALPMRDRRRVQVLEGDAASMDLGLSGKEYLALAKEVTVIHHCASVTHPNTSRAAAEATNIRSAREALELASAADHLERLVHWSTSFVSGARRGYVLEMDLDGSHGFNNAVEETRFLAEEIIQAGARDFPTTILRPSIIVGDSVTGEVQRMEGPYLLVLLMLSAPQDLRIPMPSRGDIPLNLVPIDYVVRAGLAIADNPRSIGRTFHIVDPDPLTARRVFELIAEASDRPVPRGFVPTNVAATLMRAPGLGKYAQVPRTFLSQLATEVVWDDRNARDLLASAELQCPPFEDYVKTMVDYVKAQQDKRRAARGDIALTIEEDDLPT